MLSDRCIMILVSATSGMFDRRAGGFNV